MAGQRMTYQNIQTYVKNEVRLPIKLAFHPGTAGNAWLMKVYGPGLSCAAAVAGTTSVTVLGVTFTTTNGASTTYLNGFALAMPERFSRPVGLDASLARTASGDTAFAGFWQDFTVGTSTSTPSQVYIDISVMAVTSNSNPSTTQTLTAYTLGVNTTTQTYNIYFEGIFELG